jgi:hypothetical protein
MSLRPGWWLLVCAVLVGVLNAQPARAHCGGSSQPAKSLAEQVAPLLGSASDWKPALFRELRQGMSCAEVRRLWKVEACDPARESDIQPATGPLLPPLVHHVELQFQHGRLLAASIEFDPALDEKAGAPLIGLAEKKWGPLSPEDRARTMLMWKNADSDMAYLTFIHGHWQLYSQFPTYESGPVDAALVDEPQLRARFAELLGDRSRWRAAVFGDLEGGMSCPQVKALFPALAACDPASEYQSVAAPLPGDPVVAGFEFDFLRGRLAEAKILLHERLPKELARRVSLEAFERKWGKVDERERADESVSVAHPQTFEIALRGFDGRWTFEQQLRGPATP